MFALKTEWLSDNVVNDRDRGLLSLDLVEFCQRESIIFNL